MVSVLTTGKKKIEKERNRNFLGGPVVKYPPANQGTQALSLVWRDPTCCGETEPVHHKLTDF